MGFRFRRSIRILPGVRLNISKKGFTSVSIGGKGLTVNRGSKGIRVTTSIVGSGLSYSQQYSDQVSPRSSNRPRPPIPNSQQQAINPLGYIFFGIVIGIIIMLVLKFTL